jgi:pyruvate kinase
MMKRTKIVATIGPACHDIDTLTKMMQAGMNVARLNFSHGTHADHATLIQNIRSAAAALDLPIAIMQDVQGPKIRLGDLPKEGIVLDLGSTVHIDTSLNDCKEGAIPITLKTLHEYVQPGERILIADGTIELKVQSVNENIISTEVVVPGTVYSHKGMNIPDTNLTLSALTEKDMLDLAFGVEQEVDLVAVSFVRSAADILEARRTIEAAEIAAGKVPETPIRIIAKIERPEAVEQIDSILEVVDGIMVARGDLGVEIDAADVPVVQKDLIAKARNVSKPVIVATQMLDSMQDNPRPTRAEVSDVANAVIDHTDAVMLSNETATGSYPIETVQMMHDIIVETEASKYDNVLEAPTNELAELLQHNKDVQALISDTTNKMVESVISQYRPEMPVIIVSSQARRVRQLNLSWGVVPVLAGSFETSAALLAGATDIMKQKELAQSGKVVVYTVAEGSSVIELS